MKNLKKTISLLAVLIMSFNFNNCSQPEEQNVEQREVPSFLNSERRTFTCHSFTVGSTLLGISTTMYYCCVGETLCGGAPLSGCFCGFVSESTYNDITEAKLDNHFTSRIHVDEFILGYDQETLNISYSSSLVIDGAEFIVNCKDYEVDKNGYITLELLKI